MKIISSPNSGYVKGITIIDHKRRIDLGLNVMEYIFLDTVSQIIDKHGKFVSSTMEKEFHKICGIPPEVYKSLGKKMVTKGLLLPMGKKYFIPCLEWSNTSSNYETEFEELWGQLNKVGNKKQGLTMYKRARKAGHEHEFLKERVKVYLKFLKDSGQYSMHVSTFFNPTNEQFNNEFKVTKEEKDEQNPTVYKGEF